VFKNKLEGDLTKLMESDPALEARYQANKAKNKAQFQGAMASKFLAMKKTDKYNEQYYMMTDLEALDLFFNKCNKARNELQRFIDMMDEKKADFCNICTIAPADGGTAGVCLEGMTYLFMGKA